MPKVKNSKKLFSIIIPAYRQEKTIVKDINRIKEALKKIRLSWEIIVVIDGKVDTTYQKIKKYKSSNLRVFQLKKNQGKGKALCYGMSKAKGDYVSFLDAGMEIDPNVLSMLLEHLEWYEADIIVGSKRHLASQVNYPLERKILSWGFYILVRLLFGFKIRDTQAGTKIFKKEVLNKILPVLLVKSYAIDIEMLSVAYGFGFKKIYEAPIKMEYQFTSLTNAATWQGIKNILWDTAAVFYRLKILKHYHKQAKKLNIKI
jgi:glycosyltransferase involved in cell wall biosynthesis